VFSRAIFTTANLYSLKSKYSIKAPLKTFFILNFLLFFFSAGQLFFVFQSAFKNIIFLAGLIIFKKKRGAFDSAKNHKRQRRKRQSVTAKREKSQTPKFV